MSDQIIAEMGCYVISEKPDVLACLALGSCVGVSMYDPSRNVGGLAHVMLPSSEGADLAKTNTPNKYADIAIPNMVSDLKKKGCDPSRFIVKIAGGAHMFKGLDTSVSDIGKKNSDSVREILEKLNFKISAEEIGGTVGRTVVLYLESGEFKIRSKDGEKEI